MIPLAISIDDLASLVRRCLRPPRQVSHCRCHVLMGDLHLEWKERLLLLGSIWCDGQSTFSKNLEIGLSMSWTFAGSAQVGVRFQTGRRHRSVFESFLLHPCA